VNETEFCIKARSAVAGRAYRDRAKVSAALNDLDRRWQGPEVFQAEEWLSWARMSLPILRAGQQQEIIEIAHRVEGKNSTQSGAWNPRIQKGVNRC